MSTTIHTALKAASAALTSAKACIASQNAELSCLRSVKTATAQPVVVPDKYKTASGRAREVFEALESAGFISPSANPENVTQKIANNIQHDPNTLIDAIVKMAGSMSKSASVGAPASKEQAGVAGQTPMDKCNERAIHKYAAIGK